MFIIRRPSKIGDSASMQSGQSSILTRYYPMYLVLKLLSIHLRRPQASQSFIYDHSSNSSSSSSILPMMPIIGVSSMSLPRHYRNHRHQQILPKRYYTRRFKGHPHQSFSFETTIPGLNVYSSPPSSSFTKITTTTPSKNIILPSRNDTSSLWYPQNNNPLPIINPHTCPIPVTYTNDPPTISKWLSTHISSSPSILGFDVETVPSHAPWITKTQTFTGPATIQLSTPSAALVVHLTRRYHSHYSPPISILSAVLSDPSIIKAGVNIDEDMMDLYEWNPTLASRAASRFDLAGVGAPSFSRKSGLKRLAASILDVDMPKQKTLALSDWSRCPLWREQLVYSARDAWCGAAVMRVLGERDGERFGAVGVRRFLEEGGERSVEEEWRRREDWREARRSLGVIVGEYRKYRKLVTKEGECVTDGDKLPEMLKEEIHRLKLVIKHNKPEKFALFDTESLGIKVR